jgi:hypothetical protein
MAAALTELLADPGDEDRFSDLWPYLCSEGTTWPSAYAAMPYFVDMAAALAPEKRADKLSVIGLIVAFGTTEDCPDEFRDAYLQAQQRTYPLIAEALPVLEGGNDVRWVLATIAALRGQWQLAEVLTDIQSVSGDCPGCGEEVWPDALQEID